MKKRAKKKSAHGGPRPGSGRKPLADEPLETKGFRCTESQWGRYKAAAAAEGKSLSEWIRENLDRLADEAGE